MADKPQISSELSRELNLFHITMMGMGMMIGAGVFLGMGIATGEAGPGGVMLTFALNGLLAIFTAMSFAELSSAIPRAGGAYNFARIGFGRGTSFVAGWMEWFASSVAGSMYSLTFALYTIRFFKELGWIDWLINLVQTLPFLDTTEEASFFLVKILAVITAVTFLYINFRGASETGKIGAIITVGQTIFVFTIGVVGVITVLKDPNRLANFSPFLPKGWTQLLVTMGFTYVAFEGYEVIAQAGDEAIDPRKNLPKAMLYSVLAVTFLYVLVAFATIVSVSPSDPDLAGSAAWQWIGSFNETGFGAAVAKLMPFGNIVLTMAVIFSSTSALNATVYSATRASYALGRDKMLPAIFAKIHKARKTPYGALICTGVIVLAVATLFPTKDAVSSASIMFLFLFFLVNFCVIKIRLNMADELHYGFLMPLFPLFPILAIICQIVLAIWLVHMSKLAWFIAPCWVLAGVVIYALYSRTRVSYTEDEIQIIEERKEKKPLDKYSVMVSVANPDNAAKLVRNAYRICQVKDAHVELLHMVEVPDQIKLKDGQKYITSGKESLAEAMLYLTMHFPISFTIRYCRNIARGIISAIRQKNVNMLVLGWHGKPSSRIFHLGSTIDPIIERSPSSVVILKDCPGNKQYNNILVPVAGGPNSGLALEIASIMADDNDGKITVLYVDNGQRNFDLDRWFETNKKVIANEKIPVDLKVVKSRSITRTILQETNDYDLIALGTTSRPLLAQMGKRPLPDTLAERCNKPVVITKSAGKTSWIKRWI